MYRVPQLKFDAEKAVRQGYKFLIENSGHILVFLDGDKEVKKFRKSFGLSKADSKELSGQELDSVLQKLRAKDSEAQANSSKTAVTRVRRQ